MAATLDIGHRIAPPRFIAFLLVGLATFAIVFSSAGWARGALIGFDAGALIFLLSCVPLLSHQPDAMRDRAARNDANRATLLGITSIVGTVILVAIGYELRERAALEPLGIALIIGTLLLAWLFSNMVYALHYAHLFYQRKPGTGGDAGGLDFPGEGEPDYWDFIYFAFTLGMTFQTSDVEIPGRAVRRVVIVHCLAAFIFNIGVLAFTINVIGG